MFFNFISHAITTIIILLNNIFKPTFIYFIISFISVIIISVFYIGTAKYQILDMNSITESMTNNLKDKNTISTILSTIICFLVGLYYLVKEPKQNTTFITILWISAILTIFIFTITLVEVHLKKSIFDNEIMFYITYILLAMSFFLTVYAKFDFNELKISYSNKLITIKSKLMNKSEYNGHELKV